MRKELLIDPKWDFEEAAIAAWKAYIGGGIESTGRRNNFLFNWAQMAGRERALAELDESVSRHGGWQKAANDIGMSVTTFKRLRKVFETIPDRPGEEETPEPQWHVFISHASEDSDAVARPLKKLLEERGLEVWFDESELSIGDSLREKIDHGLANSRYGVVILSKSFFAKDWPTRELNGLLSLETKRKKILLPVWHEIDHDYVNRFSPVLADRLAVNTSIGLEAVADAIMRVIDTGDVKYKTA